MSLSIGFDACPVCRGSVGGIPTFVRQLAAHLLAVDEANRYFQCYKFSRLKGWGTLLPAADRLSRLWYGRRFTLPLGKLDVFHGTAEWLPPGLKAKRIMTIHDLRGIRSCADFDENRGHQMAALADPGVTIVTDSHFIRSELLDRLPGLVAPERVTTIHLAGDTAFAPIRGSTRKDQILFVGSIAPNKNVLGLVQAFDMVRTRYRDTLLVVCGRVGVESYYRELLRFIAERPGLFERIRFVGDADNAAVRTLYNESRFCILPSNYEGFGIPVIEAQACGCPMVCSSIGPLREVGEESVLYCDHADTGSIAGAIEALLATPGRCNALAAAGFANAARFSWQNTARAYRDLYAKVAAG